MAKHPHLDEFSAHEVLDRSHLAVTFFSDHVEEHPYVQANPKLMRAAEKITGQLAEFYQFVGRREVSGR